MQAIDTLTTLELPRYHSPTTERLGRIIERNATAQVNDLALLLAVLVFALALGFALS